MNSNKGYGALLNEPQPFEAVQEKDWLPEVKKSFLVKVYSIVSLQLAVTVAFCALSMYYEPAKLVVLGGGWVTMIVAMLASFGFFIALMFLKNSFPWNLWMLAGFTVAESLLLGIICAAYQTAGEACAENGVMSCAGVGTIVWYAWAATLAVFISLTIFVMVSGIDFGFMGLFLFAGSIIMMIWGLINILFGFHASFMYGACGALLMSGYILYDTSNIMKRMGPDDWALAAIEIYMDVVTLFLYILQMFSSRD